MSQIDEAEEISHRELRVNVAPKFLPLWKERKRYKGARGGRGSGKSHHIADRLVILSSVDHVRAACMREIQNSIADSVKQLLVDKIYEHHGPDQTLFRITDREISCAETESLFIFRGLQNHTAASIKSLEGFNFAWYEESQTLTQRSLELATPTFRSDAEQLFSWNPENPEDPVDVFFRENEGDPDFLLVQANWWNNPWWHLTGLDGDMRRDHRRDKDKYDHIWGGKYRRNSSSRVFKNVRSFSFTSPVDADFKLGGDWGFAQDPTTLIRAFVGEVVDGDAVANPNGRTLFIDYECYAIGCEIDQTPKLFDSLIPESPGWARERQIRADSARPETISYMNKHGYPKVVRAKKGPGSVIEGIKFLQDYDIVIHPRCSFTIKEFNWYSYKVDKKTNEITSELEEKDNHVIDAARYAVEELRRPKFDWYVSAA